MDDILKRSDLPVIRKSSYAKEQQITYARVINVNSETQTMTVKIPSEGNRTETGIPINNMVSSHGVGIRMMPIPGDSYVFLLKDVENYIHIGYYLEGIEDFTQNRKGSKTSNILLQRYLESGEVQLLGLNNSEILLANDGSVLIKTGTNNFIKLEDYTSTLEGSFSNTKLEMDGTRIRSGNIRRPLKGSVHEDDYMVELEDGTVKPKSLLEEISPGELESHRLMKEFLIQVGTVPGEDGKDIPFDQRDPENSSPNVGWMSLATQVLDENGNPQKILGKKVHFMTRLSGGGGIAVTEDNSLYLLDYRGKNFTKFSAGSESGKSLRSGDKNFVSVSGPQGVELQHEDGASITLKGDNDGNPEIIMTARNGQNITLNKMGLTLNIDGGYITINGKEINFNAEKFTFGGALAAVTGDSLFKAKLTAAMIDVHFHAGPIGPPVVPLTPMVLTGMIASTGLNVG